MVLQKYKQYIIYIRHEYGSLITTDDEQVKEPTLGKVKVR